MADGRPRSGIPDENDATSGNEHDDDNDDDGDKERKVETNDHVAFAFTVINLPTLATCYSNSAAA